MLKLTMLLLAIVFGGSSAWAQKVIFERAKASSWTADDATGTGAVADNSNGLFYHAVLLEKKQKLFLQRKALSLLQDQRLLLLPKSRWVTIVVMLLPMIILLLVV